MNKNINNYCNKNNNNLKNFKNFQKLFSIKNKKKLNFYKIYRNIIIFHV